MRCYHPLPRLKIEQSISLLDHGSWNRSEANARCNHLWLQINTAVWKIRLQVGSNRIIVLIEEHASNERSAYVEA